MIAKVLLYALGQRPDEYKLPHSSNLPVIEEW